MARSGLPGAGTPLRRTLIGLGALAAVASMIGIGIATRKLAKSSSSEGASSPLIARAPSAVVPPATIASAPPLDLPPSLDEAVTAADPAEAAGDDRAAIAANPVADTTAPAQPTATSPETTASSIRIKIANPRPGLRVTVDGRIAPLPVRLPRDQKSHQLSFTAPNFKAETKTVIADQDHTLTLEYRPKLYVP